MSIPDNILSYEDTKIYCDYTIAAAESGDYSLRQNFLKKFTAGDAIILDYNFISDNLDTDNEYLAEIFAGNGIDEDQMVYLAMKWAW